MSIAIISRQSRRVAYLVVIGALALAGCSSGGSGGGTQAATGSGGTTVTVRNESGHAGVLATADGRTLYESEQENGTVLCKSSACTGIWVPLTVTGGQKPTAPAQVAGILGTIMRPDGTAQVALDGKPLYTFSIDQGTGQIKGDGQHDSFDGTDFTWQLATVTGSSAPAPSAPAPSAPGTSAGSSSGGYTY